MNRVRIALVVVAAAFLASMAERAVAQVTVGPDGKPKTPMELLSDEEDKRRAQNDRDYQAAMRRARGGGDPAPVNDPWASVRPAQNNKK